MKLFCAIIFTALMLLFSGPLDAQVIPSSKGDTTGKLNDSLRYAIKDRRSDFLSQPSINPFDIRDTGLVKRNIEYDAKTKQYFIREFINGKLVRVPSVLSFTDFLKLKSDRDEKDYFAQRAKSLGILNRKISSHFHRFRDCQFIQEVQNAQWRSRIGGSY